MFQDTTSPAPRGAKRRTPATEKVEKPKKSRKDKSPQEYPPPPFDCTSPVHLACLAMRHPRGYQRCCKLPSLKMLGLGPDCTPAEAGRQLVKEAKDNPVLAAELELIWDDMKRVHQKTMDLMNPTIQTHYQQKLQREADRKGRLKAAMLFLNRYGLRVPGLEVQFQSLLRRFGPVKVLGLETEVYRKSLKTVVLYRVDGGRTQRWETVCKLGDGFQLRLCLHFGVYHVDLRPTMNRVGLEMVENNIKRGQAEGRMTGIFKLDRDVMNHIAGFLFHDRIRKNGYNPQACPS
jgi:hypothetical protein